LSHKDYQTLIQRENLFSQGLSDINSKRTSLSSRGLSDINSKRKSFLTRIIRH
jgi:hypothetical protein